MEVLNKLNKNIFGENNKHASDTIDFTAKTTSDINQNNIEINDKPKPLSSNNLTEIKEEKPKEATKSNDDLSYSTYNKNKLKTISDPLTQMKPNSAFGYPTQKKEKPKEKKEEKKEDKKDNKKNNNTNTNTGNQKSKEAVMTGLFGDYSNINISKSKSTTTVNTNNTNNNLNSTNNVNNTNNTNNNYNKIPLFPNQNVVNANTNINTNINNNVNAANLQLNANMVMNYMNLINMQNALNQQQNLLLNLYKSNSQSNPSLSNSANQNIKPKNPIQTQSLKLPKKANSFNVERNELGQVFKIGNLYSDTNLIREKLKIMKSEKIKDISKATLNIPDKKYLGVLVLTDFRLLFQMENEKNLNYNYSEDYFKIPLFMISKVEKIQDKKMAFDAIPIEVTLKDTRVIKFHLYDLQRFYYNLYDETNPVDYKQFYDFPKRYNQMNFQGKNITNGWNIYNPIIEFSRQGVTEDNDLGLRYSYVNKDFKMCPTYPEILIEPNNITDEQLKQSSRYRTKGRLPICTYYYNGNVNTDLKVTPSIWRSAQNKRGLMGNKTCEADINLLNSISKLGGNKGKLYIFDCRPKLNAFVNRVGGGGYEKEQDYDNATLTFCEIDNIHKARKALNATYSLCLSNKINDFNNFWTSLEETDWYQFIYLMLKNANEISKTIQNNNSVLIHCSDGWDRTAQLSSLSQLLLDPFYRTINGFAILIEKDWLSFGHQFGLRNGFSDKDKQDQASPIFLQFLDAIHQLLEQFPNAFEFNEKFLLFLARNYRLNLYGTFLYNNEKERMEANAKTKTASVWTEIFKDLNPYLNIYYDPNSVKILEPNYSYYNLKLWTALFMENNFYLENKHFYVSDNDKGISFKSKSEFFAYKKKEDENKYMNYQSKYDELLKLMAESYLLIKDNKNIYDKLSKETKNLIGEIKPDIDKINKTRIMKKEIEERLTSKKDIPKSTKIEEIIKKDIKEEKKEEIKEKKKEEIKEEKKEVIETQIKEEGKLEIKEEKKEEIKEEKKEEKKEEIKEENKEEIKEETKEGNNEEKKEEKNEEKKEETKEVIQEENIESKNDEKKEEMKEEKKEEINEDKKEQTNEEKNENMNTDKKEEEEINKQQTEPTNNNENEINDKKEENKIEEKNDNINKEENKEEESVNQEKESTEEKIDEKKEN